MQDVRAIAEKCGHYMASKKHDYSVQRAVQNDVNFTSGRHYGLILPSVYKH